MALLPRNTFKGQTVKRQKRKLVKMVLTVEYKHDANGFKPQLDARQIKREVRLLVNTGAGFYLQAGDELKAVAISAIDKPKSAGLVAAVDRDSFMAFFKSDDYNEQLSADDCAEVFSSAIKGADDFNYALLANTLAAYELSLTELVKTDDLINAVRYLLNERKNMQRVINEGGAVDSFKLSGLKSYLTDGLSHSVINDLMTTFEKA